MVVAVLAVSACGSPGPDTGDSKLTVVASFYPLQYLAERIGGDRVSVSSLTKPGAEPHDLELTPQDVVALAQTDLVVYLKGFQPAVDEGVDDQAFDVTASADLSKTQEGAVDPHFWLDPVRLQTVAAALAAPRRADPDQLRGARGCDHGAGAARRRPDQGRGDHVLVPR